METVNTLWILLDALILLAFLDHTTNARCPHRTGYRIQDTNIRACRRYLFYHKGRNTCGYELKDI